MSLQRTGFHFVKVGGRTTVILQVFFHQQGILLCSLTCSNLGVWSRKLSTSKSVSSGFWYFPSLWIVTVLYCFCEYICKNMYTLPPWKFWRLGLRTLCSTQLHVSIGRYVECSRGSTGGENINYMLLPVQSAKLKIICGLKLSKQPNYLDTFSIQIFFYLYIILWCIWLVATLGGGGGWVHSLPSPQTNKILEEVSHACTKMLCHCFYSHRLYIVNFDGDFQEWSPKQ